MVFGANIFTLLGLLFIGLKLGGVISWSWWLVLMPIYLPLIIALVAAVGLLSFVGIVTVIQEKRL